MCWKCPVFNSLQCSPTQKNSKMMNTLRHVRCVFYVRLDLGLNLIKKSWENRVCCQVTKQKRKIPKPLSSKLRWKSIRNYISVLQACGDQGWEGFMGLLTRVGSSASKEKLSIQHNVINFIKPFFDFWLCEEFTTDLSTAFIIGKKKIGSKDYGLRIFRRICNLRFLDASQCSQKIPRWSSEHHKKLIM